jgi:iron complex transport system substrate-binding protein
MTRKTQVILAVCVSALVLAGAVWLAVRAADAPAKPDTSPDREVVDMTGRAVRVPADPERILSLCTSANDTVVALGEAARLAAIDEYGRVVPGVERARVIGKGSAISREAVLALGIDLAFVWWYQDDAAAMLEGLSVPVVCIRTDRAAEIPPMIRLVGQCLNRREAAEPLARGVEEFLDRTASDRPLPAGRPRVYLELYGPFRTVGRDSYMNDLLRLAGADNIAGDIAGKALLSAERLIQADPDVILFADGFADASEIANRPGMAGLKAVRLGRVFPVDRRWLVAGPRLPEAVAEIRGILAGASREERR